MSHFFKSAVVYRLADGFRPTAAQLAAGLLRHPCNPCGPLEKSSAGFASFSLEGVVMETGGALFCRLQTEERLLPKSVIDQETEAEANRIADEQGFPVCRKQRKEIREQVTDRLLPQAFTKRKSTRAYLDVEAGWLVVEASSAAKAETFLEHLRKALESLPLTRWDTAIAPAAGMADWLIGEAPAGFTVDRDAALQALDEGKAAVRYARHSLDGDDIRAHLAAGKLPVQLALTWADKISFALTDDGRLKRIALLDVLTEQAEADAKDAEDQLRADCTLFAGEIRQLLADLTDALGGEVEIQQETEEV